MKNNIENEILIKVNIDDIQNAINDLKMNKKYLNLNKNIFSIENITTCFNVSSENAETFEENQKYYFKFSYNDGSVKNIFKIECDLKDVTSFGFLKNNTYMDNDQLNLLIKKIYKNFNDDCTLTTISNDLYNEALIFVTSGINKEECKSIKDDFESKFNLYVKNQNNINLNIITALNNLYDDLITIKIK